MIYPKWTPGWTVSSLSFSTDLVRGMHASASIERREKGGRQPLPSRAFSHERGHFPCLTARSLRTRPQASLTQNCFLTKNVALSSQLSQI